MRVLAVFLMLWWIVAIGGLVAGAGYSLWRLCRLPWSPRARLPAARVVPRGDRDGV